MNYRVKLVPDDNGTVLVDFPDFPEAHTFGDDEADALERAQEALATIIDAYIRARRAIPEASVRTRRLSVAVPPLTEAKVAVYRAMRAQKVGKAELARRLGWHLPQVDRILDVGHNSRLDQLEAAAAVLGKRLVVGIQDLPAKRARPRRAVERQPIGGRQSSRNAVRASAGDRPRRRGTG